MPLFTSGSIFEWIHFRKYTGLSLISSNDLWSSYGELVGGVSSSSNLFHRFTYVIAHSPTLPSLHLRQLESSQCRRLKFTKFSQGIYKVVQIWTALIFLRAWNPIQYVTSLSLRQLWACSVFSKLYKRGEWTKRSVSVVQRIIIKILTAEGVQPSDIL